MTLTAKQSWLAKLDNNNRHFSFNSFQLLKIGVNNISPQCAKKHGMAVEKRGSNMF